MAWKNNAIYKLLSSWEGNEIEIRGGEDSEKGLDFLSRTHWEAFSVACHQFVIWRCIWLEKTKTAIVIVKIELMR